MSSCPRRLLSAALLAGAAVLGGCHHESKRDDQRTAAGEVLRGSISDATLPYDTLRSQPQLAPVRAVGNAASAATADSSADAATATDAGAPTLDVR